MFSFLWPTLSDAQSNLFGLGKYIIGITAPDSLERTVFKEQSESYIKGTLALACRHIRMFKADKKEIDGILINNLTLCFYDNKLIKLSCDSNAELEKAFQVNYGRAEPRPVRQVSSCAQDKDSTMLMWGEAWQNGDIWALIVHRKGRNAECEIENKVRLIVSSQALTSFASDCDLKHIDPFIEEFDKMMDQKTDR
ncbi:hypothetical protein [Spirosoma sp.]|uniref:hypothetical protein n=1 Tax=Spirosoma sp. TaxID=1899569 RepID=UPI003B3B812C